MSCRAICPLRRTAPGPRGRRATDRPSRRSPAPCDTRRGGRRRCWGFHANTGCAAGTRTTHSVAHGTSMPSSTMITRRVAVRGEDVDLLGQVAHLAGRGPGGADEDERLGGEVDVLLVLHRVGGDGLVAQLGQLDPGLLGGDPVGSRPDHRPVRVAQRDLADPGDHRLLGAQLGELVGHLQQRVQQRVLELAGQPPAHPGQVQAQHRARGDLRVERLGRGDGHLDVAAVGRVQHAVALVRQVAVAPVDDAQHGRAAGADHVDGAVGVGGGAGLAHRHDAHRGHVGPQAPRRQLGRGQRLDRDLRLQQRADDVGDAAAGDRRGALADEEELGDLAGREAVAQLAGQRRLAEHGGQVLAAGHDPAAQAPAERRRRLGDLLDQVVLERAAGDVTGGDLGRLHVLLGDRHRPRRAPSNRSHGGERARAGAAEGHDRAVLAVAVHDRTVQAQVAVGPADQAVHLARDEETGRREARRRAPGRCPRTPSSSRSGSASLCAAIANEPCELTDRGGRTPAPGRSRRRARGAA